MFGFSAAKLAVTVIAIILAWRALRLIQQLVAKREARALAETERRRTESRAHREADPQVDDLWRCPVCEAYAARGAGACDRVDCPKR